MDRCFSLRCRRSCLRTSSSSLLSDELRDEDDDEEEAVEEDDVERIRFRFNVFLVGDGDGFNETLVSAPLSFFFTSFVGRCGSFNLLKF